MSRVWRGGDGSEGEVPDRRLSPDLSRSMFPTTDGMLPRRTGYDLAGMWAALACALHCLLLVFGPLILAIPGNGLLYTPSVRWMAISLAGFLVVRSLRLSGGREHRTALAMVVGLFLLICGRLVESWFVVGWPIGEFVAVVGGLLLAGAHGLRFFGHQRVATTSSASQRNGARGSTLVLRVAKALFWISLATTGTILILDPRAAPIGQVGEGAVWSGRPQVGWDVLAQLEVGASAPGDLAPALQTILSAEVSIPGYAVPLDEGGTEFLLAPWLGACIHAPTPPPNQLIHVLLQPGVEPIDPWTLSPLWVVGRLEVVESESPYGSVSYRLRATDTSEYRREDLSS